MGSRRSGRDQKGTGQLLMLFNVPLIPDEDYTRFLNQHAGSLDACHFSLYSMNWFDSRHRCEFVDTTRIVECLKSVDIPRKYLLANSRVHPRGAYLDRKRLREAVATLELMLGAGVIDGIVFSDPYYLQAVSDAGDDALSQIEAIPSVNCMLDSPDKVHAFLEFISGTRFKLPSRLILDRSLNRNMDALAVISSLLRKCYPDVLIELMANEGCLLHCPYKLTHDCLIALGNMEERAYSWTMNMDLGCGRVLQRHPSRLFKSPFIRPEDVRAYEPYVDILKLCGRTLGPSFLKKVVGAYLTGTFSGNLLELLDAMDWLARWLHVSNHELPADFLHRLINCDGNCTPCSYCTDLLNRYARRKEFSLERNS